MILSVFEHVVMSSSMAALSPNSDELLKSFDKWLDTIDPWMKEYICTHCERNF